MALPPSRSGPRPDPWQAAHPHRRPGPAPVPVVTTPSTRPSTVRELFRAAPGLLRSRLEALWALAVASPANKLRAGIAVAVGVPLACAVLAIGAFYLAVTVFAPKAAVPSPSAGSLAETTIVYAADGSVIASLHAEHDRDIIDFAAMPQHLRDAVVAAEDSAFYSHSGLELRAIVRAAGANLRAGGTVQGGSTITQQYVKNAYVGSDRTVVRKLREARMAAQLEHHWSKDRILEAYLNTIYLGAGAYGVEAAAHRYFAKPASDLTLSESALLAGLIPAPERWSPFADEGGAELRRRYVIDRMQALGFVDAATAAEARLDRPLVTKPELTALRYPWFVDAVRRYLVTEYGERAVFSGGLRVHTSLDPEMQTAAESVMAETLGAPGDPHGAIVSVDPATGYVRALVGGRDGGEERFNIAIQGLRQPGSAFKPFVLAAALQSGMSPQERFSGPGTLCIPGWLPDCEVENYGGQGFGSLTLAEATWRSVNTVYAQLVMQVGADEAADVARRMGIDGAVGERLGLQPHAIDPLPALALGSEEVTPLEMASAYATLAARGVWREPTFVTSVRDRRGNVLEEGPPAGVRAIDEGVADEVTGILEGVITRGTGRQAAIGMPAAGKTGTASDYRNAWFVGYTPALSTASGSATGRRIVRSPTSTACATSPAERFPPPCGAATCVRRCGTRRLRLSRPLPRPDHRLDRTHRPAPRLQPQSRRAQPRRAGAIRRPTPYRR